MAPEHLWTVSALLLGVSAGSFANVVIARLPAGESIVRPRSRCPSCLSPIRWYDNIPVLSFILLRGRCRDCGAGISLRYPVVELLTGLFFAAVARRLGVSPAAGVYMLFSWALVVVSGIDLDHRIIPDAISLPGTAAGLAASLLPGTPRTVDAAVGAAAGAGFLYLVMLAYEKATGEEGMGMGDVKLTAMIGAFLGWQGLPVTILASSLAGTLAGVGFALARGEPVRKFPVPFGPFLALGALAHLFFGRELILWYLGRLS